MDYFEDMEVTVIKAFKNGYAMDEIAKQFPITEDDVQVIINEYMEDAFV